MSCATYARVESVDGLVTPEAGVPSILATRAGIVSEVVVSDGDFVAKGAPLLTISSEDFGADGKSNQTQISQSLSRRQELLADEARAMRESMASDQDRKRSQIVGIREELASLDQQAHLQESLVKTAQTDYTRAKTLSAQGFISNQDLQNREDTYLLRQQQLLSIRQQRSEKNAVLSQIEREMRKSEGDLKAQLSTIESQKAALGESVVTLASSASYSLLSPVTGRVTALSAHPGQAVLTGQPLLVLVPDNSLLYAEFYVPSAAIGFISPGQDLRIAVDAFPYQKYGTVAAIVEKISAAPISKPDSNGQQRSVFLLKARLGMVHMGSNGEIRPLLPGMILHARIVLERRNLLSWIFEPLYSIQKQ